MTDYDGIRDPGQGAPEGATPPVPQPPGRPACPRCRGTFEGDPDVCPHCGLSKTDIPAVTQASSSSTDPAPIAPAPSATAPAAPPPPAGPATSPAQPELASSAPDPVEADQGDMSSRKPGRLLIAAAVVLLAAGGVAWWLTKGGVDEDPCAEYQQQLAQVEAADHANSREERRAVAEVLARAHDAGCPLDERSARADER